MTLKNLTKKTVLVTDLMLAKSLKKKLFGLLDGNNSRSILFFSRFGIHTLGLKKAIDVIVLDDLGVIQKIRVNLQPNKLFFWNIRYKTVIELPLGTIKKTKTVLGDKLKYY